MQDHVAAEVAQAKADVDSATLRVVQAEAGLKKGLESYRGNLIGLGQTQRFNDILTLVNRPQEVVASLQQLQQAYVNYYRTVADSTAPSFACSTRWAFRFRCWHAASPRPHRAGGHLPRPGIAERARAVAVDFPCDSEPAGVARESCRGLGDEVLLPIRDPR